MASKSASAFCVNWVVAAKVSSIFFPRLTSGFVSVSNLYSFSCALSRTPHHLAASKLHQILPRHNANHWRRRSWGSSNCSRQTEIKLPCKAASCKWDLICHTRECWFTRKLCQGKSKFLDPWTYLVWPIKIRNVECRLLKAVKDLLMCSNLPIRVIVHNHCEYEGCHCPVLCLQNTQQNIGSHIRSFLCR